MYSAHIIGVSCGIPPAGDNTVVPQNSVVFEGTYTYSCLTGYETRDSLTTQCLSDGSWSSPAPTCSSECLLLILSLGLHVVKYVDLY